MHDSSPITNAVCVQQGKGWAARWGGPQQAGFGGRHRGVHRGILNAANTQGALVLLGALPSLVSTWLQEREAAGDAWHQHCLGLASLAAS
jgi:hypothetical protein